MSQSHSPIRFVLFTFDFWGTYNPYPQVQYYGIYASLAYKKRVTRTHSNIKEWSGPVTLFTGDKFTFTNRVHRFFSFCTWDVFRVGCWSPRPLFCLASSFPFIPNPVLCQREQNIKRLKWERKCNNTWDKIQHNTSIHFRYWLSCQGKP